MRVTVYGLVAVAAVWAMPLLAGFGSVAACQLSVAGAVPLLVLALVAGTAEATGGAA